MTSRIGRAIRGMVSIALPAVVMMVGANAEATDAYQCYDSLQRSLVASRLAAPDLECAKQIFRDQSKFLKELSDLFSSDLQTGLLEDINYSSVYADFIKLPAKADVLFSYLASQQELHDVVARGAKYPADSLAWGWSNLAEAEIAGYRATKEVRFIDLFLRGADVAMENTDGKRGIEDSFGQRELQGWSFISSDKPGREETTVGRVISPMIEMALVASADASLDEDRKIKVGKLADQGLNILRPYLRKQKIDGSERYFTSLWTGEDDAINHMAAFAQACAYAYKFSNENEFHECVAGFMSYFTAHVTESYISNASGGKSLVYSWPYQVLKTGAYPEMYWKGAVTVPAIVSFSDVGFDIDGRIKGALVGSFESLIVRKGYTMNAYIADNNFPVTGYNSYFQGYSIGVGFTPYILLDRWSREVRTIALNMVAFRRDLFPRGLLMHSSDAIAYAHMLEYPDLGD
jgi:hypothetical protein